MVQQTETTYECNHCGCDPKFTRVFPKEILQHCPFCEFCDDSVRRWLHGYIKKRNYIEPEIPLRKESTLLPEVNDYYVDRRSMVADVCQHDAYSDDRCMFKESAMGTKIPDGTVGNSPDHSPVKCLVKKLGVDENLSSQLTSMTNSKAMEKEKYQVDDENLYLQLISMGIEKKVMEMINKFRVDDENLSSQLTSIEKYNKAMEKGKYRVDDEELFSQLTSMETNNKAMEKRINGLENLSLQLTRIAKYEAMKIRINELLRVDDENLSSQLTSIEKYEAMEKGMYRVDDKNLSLQLTSMETNNEDIEKRINETKGKYESAIGTFHEETKEMKGRKNFAVTFLGMSFVLVLKSTFISFLEMLNDCIKKVKDYFQKMCHEANASPKKIQVYVRKCSKPKSCCEIAKMVILIQHGDEIEDFLKAELIFEGASGGKSEKRLLGGIEITHNCKLKFHSLDGKTVSWPRKVIKRCGIKGNTLILEMETHEPETGKVRRRYVVFECDASHVLFELLTGDYQVMCMDLDSRNEDFVYVQEYDVSWRDSIYELFDWIVCRYLLGKIVYTSTVYKDYSTTFC